MRRANGVSTAVWRGCLLEADARSFTGGGAPRRGIPALYPWPIAALHQHRPSAPRLAKTAIASAVLLKRDRGSRSLQAPGLQTSICRSDWAKSNVEKPVSGYRVVRQRESILFLDRAAYRRRPEKRCLSLAGVVSEPIRPRIHAAAELKCRVFQQLGHPIEESGVGLLGDLEGASTAPLEFTEQPIHVAHLAFHGVEPRQTHPRIRARHRQEVWEVGHRNAFVGLESRFPPPLSKVAALTSDHLDRRQIGLPHVKSGR